MSIWFFLFILLFFAIMLVTVALLDENNYETLGHVFRIIVLALFCFVMVKGCARPYAFNTIETEYESRKIESLNLTSTIHGEGNWCFTIGYAYINEDPFYYFYEERAGGMYLNSVSGRHSVLVETNECEPHIEMPKYRKFKDPTVLGRIFRTEERLQELARGVDFYETSRTNKQTIDWEKVYVSDKSMIRLYVPVGTIKRQYIANPANL